MMILSPYRKNIAKKSKTPDECSKKYNKILDSKNLKFPEYTHKQKNDMEFEYYLDHNKLSRIINARLIICGYNKRCLTSCIEFSQILAENNIDEDYEHVIFLCESMLYMDGKNPI